MFVLLSGTDIGHIPPLGLNMTTKAGMVGACLVVRELMKNCHLLTVCSRQFAD